MNPESDVAPTARPSTAVPGAMPPLVQSFYDQLGRSLFAALRESIVKLAQDFGALYWKDFEDHLQLLGNAFPSKPWPKWAVDGFVRFNKQILREEASFKQTGQYSATPDDFDRIAEEIYDNSDVMEGYYLVGLYSSYFIWPHHYEILSFYRDAFLRHGTAPARIAEWGVGHGLFSLLALQQWPGASSLLCDISRHSLSFSESLIRAAGAWESCATRLGDVTQSWEEEPVDRLICGEMLEHVPDPVRLLQQVHRALRPGGQVYLTGAINAPQSDHVFLFHNAEELLDMVSAQGFRIGRHVTVCHPSRRHEQNPPSVLALVAERP